MSLARLVVTAVRVEGRSKSEIAREYRLSRRWVQELVKRFDAEGEAGLAPRSRRPHTSPQRTPEALADEIVELPKTLADQGLDAGAHTIAYHLTQRHGSAPAPANIWRVLSRRGFVTPQPQKRPKSSFVRFEADLPNERWQADLTHWKLLGGGEVDILNLLDDHSRLLVAAHARATTKAADIVASFHQAASADGFPASLLTENGAVFTAAPRGGHCAIELELARGGIAARHWRPYHPQTCGKLQRLHQTLKRWLAKQPRPATITELQAQLDWFTSYDNTQRPHRALGRRTPAAAFAARPKATPAAPGVAVAAHYRVRRDKVDHTGVITLRHNSRLHHIGLGRRHAGVRVLVLVAELQIRVLTDDGQLLRALTLDPTRDYQPQAQT
jgi:transposase InsO family protein